MAKTMEFIKKNAVLVIAAVAAVATTFFVPPDKEYLQYFDLRTISCLFCTLAVVCAFKNIWFFRIVAGSIVRVFRTTRTAILALVYITLFGSMLIANDMALITFLPLGFFVLDSTDNRKLIAFTFIMQNIAANLGGMLTPFGNPQNLYLYSYFNIENGEFFSIMFIPFVLSITLITICIMFIKPEELVVHRYTNTPLDWKRVAIYSVLFALSIAIVFRAVHFAIGTAVIVVALLILDRRALKSVDYGLLLTFCAFFIFSGNMSRIPAVSELVGSVVAENTLLSGIVSCQFISNVPTAILLSRFTENYPALLVAVNVGGIGTLISSLASLITFKEYSKCEKGKTGRYLLLFSALNFGILIILGTASYFIV